MAELIPIRYKKLIYPQVKDVDIERLVKVEEIPAHFGVTRERFRPTMDYSMHTDPALEKRNPNGQIFSKLTELTKLGTRYLWHSDNWARQFFEFLVWLVGDNKAPRIIEIHPPYGKKHCKTLDAFIGRYSNFEKLVNSKWPKTIIAIENRNYSSVIHASNMDALIERALDRDCNLKVMLDIPQLITELKYAGGLNIDGLCLAFEKLEKCKKHIIGIHISGKSHNGTLDTLDMDVDAMLKLLVAFLDDGKPRYLIPEVFSGKGDFDSIINDLMKHGFRFINGNPFFDH